ncbi:MAG: DUF1217 domain-containing protein [Pseudomonadota bacterium]
MTFTPTVIGAGVPGFDFLQRTRAQQQAVFDQSPLPARNAERFAQGIDDVKSVDQLLDDRQMLRVALGAFGLEDDIDNTAFIRQILASDLTDNRSLANRLADKRYLALAQSFNFAGESGPQLPGATSAQEITGELAALKSADDLLARPALLRSALAQFGLEVDRSNSFFLKEVLNSDVSDPTSFVNQLNEPKYVELAEAFGFAKPAGPSDGIFAIAGQFEGQFDGLKDAQDLLNQPDLLRAGLELFGLGIDASRTGFLTDVLNSDISDDASFANTLDDPRYAAFSNAFGFGRPAPAEGQTQEPSILESFVETAKNTDPKPTTPEEFLSSFRLMLDTFDLYGLPQGTEATALAARMLNADRTDPNSLINSTSDTRYTAFVNALDLEPEQTERTYPDGFADAIVRNYLDRQFEVQIGNLDPAMRIALSLERDLGDVVSNGSTNDSRWFAVMASPPLRTVFETVFQLPTSFGTLDLDRQLSDFKTRAERTFGTAELADFITPDRLDQLRRRYLQFDQLNAAAASAGFQQNLALSLLQPAQGGAANGLTNLL